MKRLLNVKVIFVFFVVLWATFATGQDPSVGVVGGIFAKSPRSDVFYFIAPYSLGPGSKVYSFSSLQELIRALPVVGRPVYWLNYDQLWHSDLAREHVEFVPLCESDLSLIESLCLGGARSFPRSRGEAHPALPSVPAEK